jgi:hypothetical protein
VGRHHDAEAFQRGDGVADSKSAVAGKRLRIVAERRLQAAARHVPRLRQVSITAEVLGSPASRVEQHPCVDAAEVRRTGR